MKRILSVLLTFLLMLLLLCGCEGLQIKDQPEIRGHVDTVLAAALAGNADAAYSALCQETDKAEFSSVFPGIQELLADVSTYDLTPIHYNYSSTNGTANTQMTYRMDTDSGAFLVIASTISTKEGLVSFHIIPEEQTTLVYTGSPGHMEGASVFQWIVLILGFGLWGFVLWVFVDCCRRPIRRKPLWLLIIGLGAVLLFFTVSGSTINFRFNAGIYLTVSSLLRYGDGSRQLRIVFPLGAVLYLSMRKQLERNAIPKSSAPTESPAGSSGEEPPDELQE